MELSKYIELGLNAFEKSEDRPVHPKLDVSTAKAYLKSCLAQKPVADYELEKVIDFTIEHSVNTNDKGYSNQLWANVRPASIGAEFITSVTNTSMYTFEVAPVYTLMEHLMVEKLSEFVWGNSSAEGVITSGGTASNLQAMLCARHFKYPDVKKYGFRAYGDDLPVIICAENAHYSVKRAANILGFGHENLAEVAVDRFGKMTAQALSLKIEELKLQNKVPFMVISTAGTTVEGSFDDLESIASVCQSHQLWLHIDGAYGGSIQLTQTGQDLLWGKSWCDSFSWDFHKILGINLTCAFLLTKHKGILKSALNSGNDGYLFHEDDELDLGPKSLQCGRRPDILKLWTTWMEQGKEGLARRMDQMLQTARSFAYLIEEDERFELILPPQYLNICFRVKGIDNQLLRQRLIQDGRFMVNYSENKDGPFFRMVIGRDDLTEKDLKTLIESLHALA